MLPLQPQIFSSVKKDYKSSTIELFFLYLQYNKVLQSRSAALSRFPGIEISTVQRKEAKVYSVSSCHCPMVSNRIKKVERERAIVKM